MTPASIALLCTFAQLAIAQAPALHLEYVDGQHKTTRVGRQPIRVPSTGRISLTVVLQPLPPGAQESGGERLEVRAENQAPGYFANRQPANVTLVVRRVDQAASPEVPFKIYSSGGGLDPGKLFLLVELDRRRHPLTSEPAHFVVFEAEFKIPSK